MCCLQQFLYPSEEDLYKLIRFLVERLSKPSDGRSNVFEDGVGKRKLKAENFKCSVEDQSEKVDPDDSVFSHQKVENEFADLNIISEGTEFSDSKVTSHVQQTSEIRTETEQFQDPESKLVEEVAKASEVEHLQMELEMLKAAAKMAFDVDHPVEFHLQQFEEQMNSGKHNLLAMKSQWDAERELLEKKRQSLRELLCESNSEVREKLQKLREVELEKELIDTVIRKREEEHSKLSTDLAKQPKQASRRSYINRVKEITKNSRKQDADIDRILKETRELQLESNIIQERLHRTYAVVDELVLREVKKNVTGRQAHKLLTSIHENFEQISDKILATDRLQRETAEYEKKIAALASRSLNFDKLQADLDAIKLENDYLEQQLQHKKPVDPLL